MNRDANASMLDLFREELRNYTGLLESGLRSIEEGEPALEKVDDLIRAAHSIKGAARIMQLETIASLARTMEESLRNVQKGEQDLDAPLVLALNHATEVLQNLLKLDEAQFNHNEKLNVQELQACIDSLIAARSQVRLSDPPLSSSPIR